MDDEITIEESNAAPPWMVLDSKSKKPNKFESIKIIREEGVR
jgi:hypothetical protein